MNTVLVEVTFSSLFSSFPGSTGPAAAFCTRALRFWPKTKGPPSLSAASLLGLGASPFWSEPFFATAGIVWSSRVVEDGGEGSSLGDFGFSSARLRAVAASASWPSWAEAKDGVESGIKAGKAPVLQAEPPFSWASPGVAVAALAGAVRDEANPPSLLCLSPWKSGLPRAALSMEPPKGDSEVAVPSAFLPWPKEVTEVAPVAAASREGARIGARNTLGAAPLFSAVCRPPPERPTGADGGGDEDDMSVPLVSFQNKSAKSANVILPSSLFLGHLGQTLTSLSRYKPTLKTKEFIHTKETQALF